MAVVAVLLIFLSAVQVFGQHGLLSREDGGEDRETEQSSAYTATCSVVSSTPLRTILNVSIAPTDPSRLPCSEQIGLGLVAVAPTGQIQGSVVSCEVSPISDLARRVARSPATLPKQLLCISEPGIWRELRVVRVAVAPSWEDNRGEWLVQRIVIGIENVGGEGVAEKTIPVRPISPLWNRLYRAHVLNYGFLSLPRRETGTGKRYIIISRDRFSDFTPQMVEWKTQQGYGTELVSLEDLGFWDPTDPTAIEATKQFIYHAYATWPEPPEFVLLVGDMYDAAPEGSIYSKTFLDFIWSPHDEYYDAWYSFLDGPDLLSDVMLGRFPDTNVRRLDYMFAKSIDYEKNPNREGQWQRNAVMTATHPDLNHPTIQTKIDVDNDLDEWGMNSTLLINQQANPASIVQLINQGLSFYNFRGWLCSGTNWNGTFQVGDVDFISNPRKLPVYTAMSCGTARIIWTFPTVAEALLRHGYQNPSNPIGAVAFIGSQGGTWYLHNNALDRGIYASITEEEATLLGEALLSGKIYAYNNTAPSDTQDVMMKEYTILGDPSLQFWTEVPQAMLVSMDPSWVPAGQSTDVSVAVTDSATTDPVVDALVCLWRPDDVYAYGYADESGTVVLPVLPESDITTPIDLTVTAYNMVPVFDSIQVTARDLPEPPLLISLNRTSEGGIEIRWSCVTRKLDGSPVIVDRYEVYHGSKTDFPAAGDHLVGISREPRYIDSGLSACDSTFFYRVMAIAKDGSRSELSKPVGVSRVRLEK